MMLPTAVTEPSTAATVTSRPAAPSTKQSPVSGLTRRLRAVALAMLVPMCRLLIWDWMVRWTGTRLVPLPSGVAVMMWDFAFGGIYDDAYSASLPIHFWKSVQRVYGGFF